MIFQKFLRIFLRQNDAVLLLRLVFLLRSYKVFERFALDVDASVSVYVILAVLGETFTVL